MPAKRRSIHIFPLPRPHPVPGPFPQFTTLRPAVPVQCDVRWRSRSQASARQSRVDNAAALPESALPWPAAAPAWSPARSHARRETRQHLRGWSQKPCRGLECIFDGLIRFPRRRHLDLLLLHRRRGLPRYRFPGNHPRHEFIHQFVEARLPANPRARAQPVPRVPPAHTQFPALFTGHEPVVGLLLLCSTDVARYRLPDHFNSPFLIHRISREIG